MIFYQYFFLVYFDIFSIFLFSNILKANSWTFSVVYFQFSFSLYCWTLRFPICSFLSMQSQNTGGFSRWEFFSVAPSSLVISFRFISRTKPVYWGHFEFQLEITISSIIPFLLIIKELLTKLWSILQDLQCNRSSNTKCTGDTLSLKTRRLNVCL